MPTIADGQVLAWDETVDQFVPKYAGSLPPGPDPDIFGGFANPSAQIGLTPINGSAITAMRADAAPALSQSITPTWTGSHTFRGGFLVEDAGGADRIKLDSTSVELRSANTVLQVADFNVGLVMNNNSWVVFDDATNSMDLGDVDGWGNLSHIAIEDDDMQIRLHADVVKMERGYLEVGVASSAPGMIALAGSISDNVYITASAAAGGWVLTLPNSAGSNRFPLLTNGAGVTSWSQLLASDIGSGQALTRTNDTNVTLTLGGTPTTALLAGVSLTLGWTGTLAVGRGGIGVATLASNGVLYGNGTGAVQALAVNATATNKFLRQVSSGAPSWEQVALVDLSGLGTGVATFLATPSSANLLAAVTDETGTGALVFATSPTLVTPTLGVATATSINKVAITAPSVSATLTIANGKTLTANSSLTLAGVDAKTLTVNNTLTLAGTDSKSLTLTGSLTIGADTSITGGGTLALGGFTGTLPATGTLVISQGVAGGQTVKGGTGSAESLTLNSTAHATKGKIFLGAASAYDEATIRLGINKTSPQSTLHVGGNIVGDSQSLGSPGLAIFDGADVFSSAGAFYIYYDGDVELEAAGASVNFLSAASYRFDNSVSIGGGAPTQALDVAGNILVNAATANLYLKNTATGWQSASSTVITPQANNSIRSTSFTSGLIGWGINAAGDAEFANVTVRGALRSSVLLYNAVLATNGSQIITKAAARLRSDVTVPSSPTYGTTTVTIDVVDQDGLTHAGSQLFVVNDILQLKDGLAGTTWFKVTAVSDQTTFWRYTASIQAGTNNVTYRAGLGTLDYGATGGFIIETADQANSPYIQMATHAGTFTSANSSGTLSVTPQLRIGNLNGSYGFGSDTFGFGTGQYGAASKSWITVEQTNGLRIGNNTTTLAQWDTSGVITVGQVAAAQSNILISAGVIQLRNNTTVRAQIASDGSAFFGSGNLAVSAAGVLTVGSWTVNSTTLTGTNTTLDSAGKLTLGTTTNVIILDANDATYRLAIGHSTYASAPFRVDKTGAVTATSGTIGGWTLSSTAITSGTVVLASNQDVPASGTGHAWFGKGSSGYYGWRAQDSSNRRIESIANNSGIYPYFYVHDGTRYRVVMGGLNNAWNGDNSGTFGMKIWNTAGTKLAEFSDSQNMIANWNISSTQISNNGVYLDAGTTDPVVANVTRTWMGYGLWSGGGSFRGMDVRYYPGSGSADYGFQILSNTNVDSGKPYMMMYDSRHRIVIGTMNYAWNGYTASSGMGMKIWGTSGDYLVEFSDTRNVIAGWTIAQSKISSTGIDINSGAGAGLAFGATPPVSASSGTGIWIDSTGMFGLTSSTRWLKVSNGAVYLGATDTNVRLTPGGLFLSMTPASAINFDNSAFVHGKISGQDGGGIAGMNFLSSGSSTLTTGRTQLTTQSFNALCNAVIVVTAPQASASDVRIYGDGNGVGGTIAMAGVTIGANSAPTTSAILDLATTTGALLLPRLTTTQRDALTAANGMLIYNTTTGKFQGRAAGAWVDLH